MNEAMMSYTYIFLAGLLFYFINNISGFKKSELDLSSDERSDLVVKTEDGLVRGWCGLHSIPSGRQIYSFTRIPYARPPIGQLRFQPPQPPVPWGGIYNATRDMPECFQYRLVTPSVIAGQEDCLYLNVHTPQNPNERPTTKLPVLFYIHGGGFHSNSGRLANIGPEKLLEKDVVFVSINYRLGPFGFIATNTCEAPGNNGAKDAVAALRWVKRNIHVFGGNPSDITVQGHSAGSAIAEMFLTSPMTSSDLFHKAILHSGTVCWLSLNEDMASVSYQLAEAAGCPLPVITSKTVSHKEMLECLSSKTGEEIIVAYNQSNGASILPVAIPTIEPDCPDIEPFLTEHPSLSIQEGRVRRVPIIVGETRHEAVNILTAERFVWTDYRERFFTFVLSRIRSRIPFLPLNPPIPYDSQDILRAYYPGQNFTNTSQTYLSTIKLANDVVFAVCTDNTVNLLLQNGVPVYEYRFDFIPFDKASGTRLLKCIYIICSNITVSHGQDLLYLLNGLQMWTVFRDNPENDEDRRMNQIMVGLITNFVRYGYPSNVNDEDPYLRGVFWPPSSYLQRHQLRIGDTLQVKRGGFTSLYSDEA